MVFCLDKRSYRTKIKKSGLATTLSDRAKPIPKIVAFALEVFPFGETTLICMAKIEINLPSTKIKVRKL